MNENFYILFKILPKVPIDLDNGLAQNRRKVIIWTNADQIHWRIYATLRGDDLLKFPLQCPQCLHKICLSPHRDRYTINDTLFACLFTPIFHAQAIELCRLHVPMVDTIWNDKIDHMIRCGDHDVAINKSDKFMGPTTPFRGCFIVY